MFPLLQNYVTYREFLIYLEEYQKTKIGELKIRKPRMKNNCAPSLNEGDSTGPPIEARLYYPQELSHVDTLATPLSTIIRIIYVITKKNVS